MKSSRRRFLIASTVAGISGIAGCSSTGDQQSDTPTETSTTPTSTDTEPESTETETPSPNVVAEIDDIHDHEKRDSDNKYVEIVVSNTAEERLLAALVPYYDAGLVFDIPAGGTRRTRVYVPGLNEGPTDTVEEGDLVDVPQDWAWYPGDYPREFAEGEVEADPAIPVGEKWAYPLENPTSLELEEIGDFSADGKCEYGDNGTNRHISLGGSVVDEQLVLYQNTNPAPWECEWTVELTGTTSKETFTTTIEPPELSLDSVDFTVEEGEHTGLVINSFDVDITAESEQPLFNAELRFYDTHNNLNIPRKCYEPGDVTRGWYEENAYVAPSFLGRLPVSDHRNPVINATGEDRVGKTKTVTFEKGENGTAECMNYNLVKFETPIESEEAVIVQLVSGFSVIDSVTSEPIANQL